MSAFAEKEVNLLRLNPPGGSDTLWIAAETEVLSAAGYKVTTVGFTSCQDAAGWVKDHPTTPYLVTANTDPMILNLADPKNPASCNIPLTEKTLVTLVGKAYHMICAKDPANASLEAFRSKPAKIGIWNSKLGVTSLKQHLVDLQAKNVKVIPFATGKDMLTAFVATDIDYVTLTQESLVNQVNAQCFLTSANAEFAAKTPAKIPRVSMMAVNKNLTFPESGSYVSIIGNNVDAAEIRKLMVIASRDTAGKFYKMMSPMDVKGVFIGESVPDQFKEIDAFVKKFNKTVK